MDTEFTENESEDTWWYLLGRNFLALKPPPWNGVGGGGQSAVVVGS